MSRLPNFLIIGAQRSGTTSLYFSLRQHPQVFMSRMKEPHFFSYEGRRPPNPAFITTFEDYRALFAGAGDEIAVGEASPSYLISDQAPLRIARHLPSVKLIAILRDPAERAFSQWVNNRGRGREPLDFADALNAEEERIRNGAEYAFWYKRKGFYQGQLGRYQQIFDLSRIGVYLFDDLRRDPRHFLREIFRFLGVDEGFEPRFERRNASWIPRGRFGGVVTRLRRNKLASSMWRRLVPAAERRRLIGAFSETPELSCEERASLIELYRDDILRLESTLSRDLSAWLE